MATYFFGFHEPTGLYIGGSKLNHRNELCNDLNAAPILFPAIPLIPELSFEGARSFYTPANEFKWEAVEVGELL